jgi:hypothetical protein
VGRAVDGEADLVLRDDAPGHADPRDLVGAAQILRAATRFAAHVAQLRQAVRSRRGRAVVGLSDVHEAVRRRRLERREPDRRRSRVASPLRRERHLGDAPAEGGRSVRSLHPLHRARTADQDRSLRSRRRAPRSLHDGQELRVGRGGVAAARHHAHHQCVLRLGLQLVRSAAQRWHLVSDRLRESLPRLAGDVAALPLPVVGDGQHQVVDLLRSDQATVPQEPRLGTVLRHCQTRFAIPRQTAGLRRHLSHLDEVALAFFATDTAKDAVRKKVAALFPAHEVEPFTDLFWKRIAAWRADVMAEKTS